MNDWLKRNGQDSYLNGWHPATVNLRRIYVNEAMVRFPALQVSFLVAPGLRPQRLDLETGQLSVMR